jgi:putative endonuclease
MKTYCVYILASDKNGTLYIGVTDNLLRRVYEHKRKLVEGFSKQHNVNKLVYFEDTDDIPIAIQREKQLKGWNRNWKLDLIEEMNPDWKDLYYDYGGEEFDANMDYNSMKNTLLDSRSSRE